MSYGGRVSTRPVSKQPAPARRRCAVRRSPIHGRGVFALRRIRAGSRIIEYTGERLGHDEIDRRYGDRGDGHTMLFTVDEETTIDATRRGSIARYINHSCAGNCQAVEEGGRIFIEAVRNIQPGAELTYDYKLIRQGRLTRAARHAYACHCGAAECRGTLLDAGGRQGRSLSRRGAADAGAVTG